MGVKSKKKRQRILYSNEAEKYLREHYGETSMYNVQKDLKKITGKLLTYNAIRIKAYRYGLESMQQARSCILVKDLNKYLNTQQGSRYAVEGGFTRKEKGINGSIVNVQKFWKWAEKTNIDLTGYERGTLLPEPKADASGRSWLDRRIAQQVTEKHNAPNWDNFKVAKLKRLVKEKKLTRQQIADILGVNIYQLNYQVEKLELAQTVKIKVTDKEREEVRELYKNGATIAELMKMYSRCRKTIKNIIKGMYADEEGENFKA